MKYMRIIIFLTTIMILLLPGMTTNCLEQPPVIKTGYEWAYDITFYNKTSGEETQYTSIVSVAEVSAEEAIIKGELYDANEELVMTIYTVLDQNWRVINITYVYSGTDYTIQDIYTSSEKPLYMIYPSSTGEEYSVNALSDTYIDNEYYYSTKEIYYITVQRTDKIIYRDHVIPSYVVTIIQELRDPDTDYLYTKINTTYWINKDFIHPFLIIQEDEETRITYVLKYYKLDYEPLDNYPTISQKIYVDLDVEINGNYTLSAPDAKITISRNNEVISEYSIEKLPVSISLEKGDYTFTITPIEGKTIDQKGLYKFLKWSINGVEQTSSSITISLTSNTSITIYFYVYTPPAHATTTTIPPTTTTTTTYTTRTTQQTTTQTITTITTTTQEQGQETTIKKETTTTTTNIMINNQNTEQQTTPNIATTNPYIPTRRKEDNTIYLVVGAIGLVGAGTATYLFLRKRKRGAQAIVTKPYQPPYSPQQTTPIAQPRQTIPVTITAGSISVEKTRHKLKKCPYCGALIPLKAKYCPKCGKKLPETSMETDNKYKICPVCGAKIPAKAKFCPKCGARLT